MSPAARRPHFTAFRKIIRRDKISKNPPIALERVRENRMNKYRLSVFKQSAAFGSLWIAASGSFLVASTASKNANAANSLAAQSKRIIGATATLTETSTGLSFPARVDTGAETCSLHVEKVDIEDKTRSRLRNIGKTIRFLLKGSDGRTKWVEAVVADAVRVKSSSLKGGEGDHRYKVRLTLEWKDVRKEVLVTLNDRTAMEYPLLVGRNFLEGDFLVDVELDPAQR